MATLSLPTHLYSVTSKGRTRGKTGIMTVDLTLGRGFSAVVPLSAWLGLGDKHLYGYKANEICYTFFFFTTIIRLVNLKWLNIYECFISLI